MTLSTGPSLNFFGDHMFAWSGQEALTAGGGNEGIYWADMNMIWAPDDVKTYADAIKENEDKKEEAETPSLTGAGSTVKRKGG